MLFSGLGGVFTAAFSDCMKRFCASSSLYFSSLGDGMTKSPRHRELLGYPEAVEALNEMDGHNDRTCAIVGLAFLENNLVLAIMSRLRTLSDSEQRHLFEEPLSLLSSFSRKVEIADALNLITEKIKKDLDRLNKIRNKFAHFLEVRDFNHPEVAPLCDALIYGAATEKALARTRPMTRREKFTDTVMHLSVRFAKAKDHPSRPTPLKVRTPPCYE